REDDRLKSFAPGRLPRELFPETEARFFVRGEPGRLAFHRDETGRVDYLIASREITRKAPRRSTLPAAPVFTNAIIAATTGGRAVEAGLEILQEGGSAVDAA